MAFHFISLGFTQTVKRTSMKRRKKKPKDEQAISQPKDGDFCCAIITDYLSTIKRLHHRLLQQIKKDPDRAKTI
jgi:hypothetical protein